MFCKLTPILNTIHSQLDKLPLPDLSSGELRAMLVLATFWILFGLEARFTYRKNSHRTSRQSYFTNIGSFILNDTLMSLLSISSLWLLADRYSHVGLLSQVANPGLKAIASFLLLDLVLYLWHRANHSFDALWTFHKIHHSDRSMNVSTAFRLHGVEVFMTALIKAAFIVIVGIDSAVLLANEALTTLFVMFHHTNIAFRGERWLGRAVVVPSIHRAHHSTVRAQHDNNYGAVFSFWDRLFGTFTSVEPKEIGLAGVPGYSLLEFIRFGLPASPKRPTLRAEAVRAMIAEAAYFRAEKRGFAPGYDFVDWVEAEREILSKVGIAKPKGERKIPWIALNPWPMVKGQGSFSSC
jgi:sterol desaturase/sphingolipid hydroxylase (fatty acid hydroxylase superfamily)